MSCKKIHDNLVKPLRVFERRQMTALRKELDQEYEAEIGLDAKPSKDRADQKIPSTART